MITLDTIATTRDGLREQATELNIPGRGRMNKDQLATAVRAEVELRQREATVARAIIDNDEATLDTMLAETMANLSRTGVTSVTFADEQSGDVTIHAVPAAMTHQHKATPATVFGSKRSSDFALISTKDGRTFYRDADTRARMRKS